MKVGQACMCMGPCRERVAHLRVQGDLGPRTAPHQAPSQGDYLPREAGRLCSRLEA